MPAKKRRPVVTYTNFMRALRGLRKHLQTLEEATRENRASLELQFKRIASIQAELDQLQAHLRRTP